MNTLESINRSLFLWINASAPPDSWQADLGRFCADYVIWLLPIYLVFGWLRGSERHRLILLSVSLAALLGLGINQLIGLVWYHPRPFEIGLGQTLLAHARESSFPSDHFTLMIAVAVGLLLHSETRLTGILVGLLGLVVAWGRVYVGVHFPLDMAGALVVGTLSAMLLRRCDNWLARVMMQPVLRVYRLLCSPLIKTGWALR